MSNFYKDEFCMMFTNEEIINYLVKPLKKYSELLIRLSSSDDEEVLEDTNEEIKYVSFDGDRENFHLSFYGDQTSIFISDEYLQMPNKYTFNEEFMFIDDLNKQYYTSSDTDGNVVYEGKLRDKSHQEILELFCEFILLLIGAKKILIKETKVSQKELEYPKFEYIVNIFNDSGIKKHVKYDNILFSINEANDMTM